MKALRNYLDKIKPNFEEGGKFHAFQSVFDGKSDAVPSVDDMTIEAVTPEIV